VPVFNALVRGKHRIAKFATNKLETSLYCIVLSVFRHLATFKRLWRVWRTDRETDRHFDIKRSLQYVARPKILSPMERSFNLQ